MKIVVYAICKNEEKFINRWYESMKEADEIYVLDTGSTDNSVTLLKSLGINVKQEIINPWRFDIARNKSLEMVPLDTDICVCTDIDEVLEPNWRIKLENTWNNCNRLKYKYNWSFDKYNNPSITFLYDKIHDRLHYKWIYPVHEVLEYTGKNEIVKSNIDIVLNHYPDSTKSRSSYLPLLELAYKENPDNDRIQHYLGREYMYHDQYNNAIDTLINHVRNNKAWDLEKSASMRFISRCYIKQNRINEALMWLNDAIKLTPNVKEPYVERAILYFNIGNYFNSLIDLLKAKSIVDNSLLYINEPFCHDSTIDDYISLCFYNLGLIDEAIFFVNKAIDLNKEENRLYDNLKLYKIKKELK